MRREKCGQAWALEVLLAVSVFVIIFVFVFSLIGFSQDDPYKKLQSQTISLANAVTQDSTFAFVSRGQVDKEKFAELATMNYRDLKKKLGIKDDFCIFFEDSEGNMVNVSVGGKTYTAIGNGSSINLSGVPCGG